MASLQEGWSVRLVSRLGGVLRAARRQLAGQPAKTLKLRALAMGYRVFDALCLVLMFEAMGVSRSHDTSPRVPPL